MKQFKGFLQYFNNCYYILLAIYHNTLQLIDNDEREITLMATLRELLDGISTDVDTVVTGQEAQSKEIEEIGKDVEKLHADLQNQEIPQEFLDKAQAIKDRLAAVKTKSDETTTTLRSINDKTAAIPETSNPSEGDADEDEEDPNAGTILEGTGETV